MKTPVKIYYGSDLHINLAQIISEYGYKNSKEEILELLKSCLQYNHDTNSMLILAGDIFCPEVCQEQDSNQNNYKLMMNVLDNFSEKYFEKGIRYVYGNHEYYGSSIKKCRYAGFDVLDNEGYLNDILEFAYFGGTMWSDFNNDILCEQQSIKMLNDFKYIENFKGKNGIRNYKKQHKIFLNKMQDFFNSSQVQKYQNKLLITHHSPLLTEHQFSKSILNFAFEINLLPILKKMQITHIICGHSHVISDEIIEGIKFCRNPKGLPHDNCFLDWGYYNFKELTL